MFHWSHIVISKIPTSPIIKEIMTIEHTHSVDNLAVIAFDKSLYGINGIQVLYLLFIYK